MITEVTDALCNAVCELAGQLEEAAVGHCFVDTCALFLQGVTALEPTCVVVEVQWDAMERVHGWFAKVICSPLVKTGGVGAFDAQREGMTYSVRCQYNTVVATDPYRIAVEACGRNVWVKSLYYYQQNPSVTSRQVVQSIDDHLRMLQQHVGELSKQAWEQQTFDAWVNRHGSPSVAAAKIASSPVARLYPLANHLGALPGKRVMNLMGSHGGKAVAMALMGADVTVVDVSAENSRYALEVARAAGVALRYVVADVLQLTAAELTSDYDIVLMELGILHYFVDLHPLWRVVHALLRSGGRLVLHEFHPISTKLITSKGQKHKVTGNYFDLRLESTIVAHAKYGEQIQTDQPVVRLRKWTLGEVVSSVAESGLPIVRLSEEPNHKLDDIGLPKTFTLLAEKI